jgi:hypothetical protein
MPESEDALDAVGSSRRRFVTRLAVGTAFAAPVVSSFSMNGVSTVFAQSSQVSGGPTVGGTGVTNPPNTTTTTVVSNTTTTTVFSNT